MAKTRASRSETELCDLLRHVPESPLPAQASGSLHVLDLLFGGAGLTREAKDARLSERRENRYRLIQRLLKEWWGEETLMDDCEKIRLHISHKVKELMEERRILMGDVKKVIRFCREVRGQIFQPGPLAGFFQARPCHVLGGVQPRRRSIQDTQCILSPHGSGGEQEAMKKDGLTQSEGHWSCAKCGEPLKESQVQVQYVGNVFSMKMLTCPKCGVSMVTEEMATDRMAEAERVLEDK